MEYVAILQRVSESVPFRYMASCEIQPSPLKPRSRSRKPERASSVGALVSSRAGGFTVLYSDAVSKGREPVGHSSAVERRIQFPEVAGSSPVVCTMDSSVG